MSVDTIELEAIRDVRREQAHAHDWAVHAGGAWSDAGTLLEHLRSVSNHVEAAEQVEWDALLGEGAEVLDLGCGSGWLTAMLSARPHVAGVVAWDASPHLLGAVLPEMLGLLGGRPEVVERVCGSFTPLPLPDASLDLVAMSSAFHHCNRPVELLGELRRVLRPDGHLVLVNETPWRRLAMVNFAVRTLAAAAVNLVATDRVRRRPGHLAAGHALYDEQLGDRAYTVAQWRDLARRGGFSLEIRDTGLAPYKPSFRERSPLESNLATLVMRPRRP